MGSKRRNEPEKIPSKTILFHILLCGALFYALSYGAAPFFGQGVETHFWIAGGFALAAMLAFGLHASLGILIGALLFYTQTLPQSQAIAQAGLETFGTLTGAVIIKYYAREGGVFDSPHNTITFFIGVFITVLTLVAGAVALHQSHLIPITMSADLPTQLLAMYLASFLVATPYLFMLLHGRHIQLGMHLLEKILLAIIMLGLLAAFFTSYTQFNLQNTGIEYVLFLPLIWAASRFQSYGAALSLFVTGSVILLGTVVDIGPFIEHGKQNYVLAHVFCVIGAMMALIVAPKREKFTPTQEDTDASLSFKSLTDAIPAPIFYKDDNGFYAGHNKNFEEKIGSSKKWALEKLMTLPDNHFEVMQIPYDNNIIKEVQVSTSNYYDRNRNVLGSIGILNDITESQNMRKRMQHWKERYELALEGSDDGLWDWDITTDKIFFSRRWKEIMGYHPNEEPDSLNHWLNLVHASSLATVNEAIRNHLDGKTPRLHVEHRIKSIDDSIVWVRIQGKAHLNEQGVATRMVGYATNITEQKLASKTLEESRQLFARFMDNLPGNAFIQDGQGRFIYLNQHYQQFLGTRHGEGKTAKELFGEAIAEEIQEKDRLTIYEGETKQEQKLPSETGKPHLFQMYKFSLSSEKDPKMLGGIGIDITKEKLYLERINLFAKIFENTSEGIMVTNAQGTIIAVNRAFTTLTGFTPKETVGNNPRFRKSGRYSKKFYEAMWYALINTGSWKGELFNLHKNGQAVPELMSINAIKDKKGETKNYVAIFTSIVQQKQQESRLKHLAHFDSLTNLPNRFLFHDRLRQAMNRSERVDDKTAVFFIDLDDFKKVNDTYGHDAGDTVLKNVAKRLKEAMRDTDTVARLAGDEFTVIAEQIKDVDDIQTIANKITAAIKSPITHRDTVIRINASIGISVYPDHGRNEKDLLKHADMAMYQVKKEGKNSVAYYQG